MRAPVRSRADHVVGRHFGLCNRVSPVFEGEHLVLEEGMREACHVSGDEHIVGDDPVHVERTAPRVAGHASRTRGQA